MRPTLFSGMLMLAVSDAAARASDLPPGAAAREVEMLLISLDAHPDAAAAERLRESVELAHGRLSAIRSGVLLAAAIEELAIQAECDLALVHAPFAPLRAAA